MDVLADHDGRRALLEHQSEREERVLDSPEELVHELARPVAHFALRRLPVPQLARPRPGDQHLTRRHQNGALHLRRGETDARRDVVVVAALRLPPPCSSPS